MKKVRKDQRFTFRLPSPVVEALKRMADEQGHTPSRLICDIVTAEAKRAGYLTDEKEVNGETSA